MTDAADSFPMQIIDGDGVFNVTGLESFVKEEKIAECGVSYAVVSIMGPQSSGKSTLLNHLFHTAFREMDSDEGRSQTTRGIWLSRAVGFKPCTLVMDLEGTDGRERGEDDTAFDRQSALFALAVSDIVLINMWCHDVGREQAANKPLLRTVFQVMAQLFTPRKTTLMFIIRDKTRSPMEKLESILRQDIQRIWECVSKSGALQGLALSEFFDVQVFALPSFEENEELFDEEMVSLRQRLSHLIAPGGIPWDRQGVVHASGFSINAQQIWRRIKENKDLDLPSLTVMVNTIRCEEIAQEKFHSFLQNKVWHRLEEAARSGTEPHFGRQLTYIVKACLSGYQEEALPFDERVRISKKELLEEKLLELVQPAFQSVVGHLRFRALGMFTQALKDALGQGEGFTSSARSCFQKAIARFDEECANATIKQAKWDISKEKRELEHDMKAHIDSQRSEKLSELINSYEAKLNDALAEPVEALLENANDKTWPSIRDLLWRQTNSTVDSFLHEIRGFEMDERNKRNILGTLWYHAIGVVETKAREGARKVLILMKERFSRLFFLGDDSMHRILTGKENYWTITGAARSASLKLLAVMAVMRLNCEADNIESILSVNLLVPPSRTLITPVQCESLWRLFIQETKCVVSQSFSVQVKVNASLCEEISNKMFLSFSNDKDWIKLKKAARKGPVLDFGTTVSSMIHDCLSRYDIKTKDSDKVARMSSRVQLKEKLLHLVRPSFQYILGHIKCDTLNDFQEAFDKAVQSGECFSLAARDCTRHYMYLFHEACIGVFIEQADWAASMFSADIQRDMNAHVAYVQSRMVSELVKACKGKLSDAFGGSVETLLDGANDETWSSIRKLLHHETVSAVSDLNVSLSDFIMDDPTKETLLDSLRDHAKGVVEEKAREGASRASFLMKDRFSRLFFLDDNSMLRVWTEKEDVVAITQAARSSSLKLLSVMAAVRLDDAADHIEGTLSSALLSDHCSFNTSDGSEESLKKERLCSLVSDTWDENEILLSRTLLTPAQCESLWKQFIQETERLVARAFP